MTTYIEKNAHIVPVQNAGKSVHENHPLISLPQRCKGAFGNICCLKLSATGRNFEAEYIVCTVVMFNDNVIRSRVAVTY